MTELQTRPLAELEQIPQWVVWRYEKKGDRPKPTKVLYDPATGCNARTDDPRTWGTYCAASNAHLFGLNKSEYDGIGFVFTVDDPYFGVDLDNCIEGGAVAGWAAALIDRFGSYWETSVSGKGLHCIAKGRIPDEYRTGKKTGRRDGLLEIYDNGRYFTVSEDALNALPVRECQQALNDLMAERFSEAPTASHSVDATLADAMAVDIAPLLEKIEADPRLSEIWNESVAADQSSQDYRFTVELFRAIPGITDAEAMALVSEFRRESGNKPEKADREDYLHRTVEGARSVIAGGLQAFDDVLDVASNSEAGASDRDKLRLFTIEELLQRPPPAFLVDKMLPCRGVGILAGVPGSFKSFVALTIGLSIATGRKVGELETKSGPVWYLANEGQHALAWRAEAWRRFNNIKATPAFKIAEATPSLDMPRSVDAAIKVLGDNGERPMLIVIDTFAKAAGAAEINSAKEVGGVINNAYRIADRFGCFVLLIDHVGKDEKRGPTGSYIKRGSTDFVGLLTKANDTATLVIDKQKDGEDGLKFYFQKNTQTVIESEGGEFCSWPVLMCGSEPQLSQPDFVVSYLAARDSASLVELKEAFGEAYPGKTDNLRSVLSRLEADNRISQEEGVYRSLNN